MEHVAVSTAYAELEISLRRIESERYEVELRFSDPEPRTGARADEGAKPREMGEAAFDFTELLCLQLEPEAYGKALTRQLFHSKEVCKHYKMTRSVTSSRNQHLRIRLWIHPSAVKLNSLRWELLRDPDSEAPLATSEKTLFSRFVEPRYDWLPVKLRRKTDLKALVAVSAPINLAEYSLPEVDRDLEIKRVRAIFEASSSSDVRIEVTTLGDKQPFTVERLLDHLRKGVDLLYIVCHGKLSRRKKLPTLYFQDEDRKTDFVTGDKIVEHLGELQQLPRLVVLASCESASEGRSITPGNTLSPVEATAEDKPVEETPLPSAARAQAEEPSAEDCSTGRGSLARQLVLAGVPAVLAMQGNVSVQTIKDAMPIFFEELLRDGQIDRALAVARGKVRERDDFWMPVLFLRLRQGRIWYEPHFAEKESDFEKWKSICSHVRDGKVIPILGPGISEQICGTPRELARRLAVAGDFPLAPHDRSDLAKVAQYLTFSQSRGYAQSEVKKQLRRQVLERNTGLNDKLPLPQLLALAGEQRRQVESDPYRILSKLPARIYVNACTETLLFKSLEAEEGKKPELLSCNWRETGESHRQEPSYKGEPNSMTPIVYQVFGDLDDKNSLVLTADDFFDYLIATASDQLLPTVVRGSFVQSSLLFLGFDLTDWTFQVLFRLIMNLRGCHKLKWFSHVAVQVEPEEDRLLDLEGARRYLEGYFSTDRGLGRGEPRIDIYWGRATDFLNELRQQLDRHKKGEGPADQPEGSEGGWY